MPRFSLYLTDRQDELLRQEAGEIGIGINELIRRLLDSHIDSYLGVKNA